MRNIEEIRRRIVYWREASQRLHDRDFLGRNWLAVAMADADILIDTLEELLAEMQQ